MTISFSAIATYAISDFDDSLSLAESSAFRALLSDPDAKFIYLIEFSPFNDEQENSIVGATCISTNAISDFGFDYIGGIEPIYLSDFGYLTEPSDDPSNTTYLAVATNPFQFDVSILSGEDFRGGIPSFGAIRILNGDAELDAIETYHWGGRGVQIYAGQPSFTRAQFEKIFDGICSLPEFSEDEIIINISDKSSLFDTDFVQELYEGTGGLEGGADIKGTPKPLAYGECLNIAPVLVDAANLIYQVHDGAINSVDEVYDKGVLLTGAGNVSDITAASVSAGQYKTQLSGGYIKLGSTPSGRITADIKGDASDTGYVYKIGEIVQRIVKTKLGINSLMTSDIDNAAFNTMNSTITGKAGFYITDRTNARTIIDQLIIPVHCYWSFTRQGLLTVGVLDEPGTPTHTITEDQIVSYDIVRVIPAAWRVTLGYARNWTRQTLDDVAAAATSSYKTFALEEFRTVKSEDGNIRRLTAQSKERAFDSLLVESAEATTELSRIANIYCVTRRIYRVEVVNLLFRVYIGDTIEINASRYGLDAGKNLVIVSISEDAETNTSVLELWG